MLWLILLFLTPLYAILAVAMGRLDPVFATAIGLRENEIAMEVSSDTREVSTAATPSGGSRRERPGR